MSEHLCYQGPNKNHFLVGSCPNPPLPPADGDQPAHGRRDNPYVVRTVDAALLLHFVLPVFQQPGIELWKPWSGVIEL